MIFQDIASEFAERTVCISFVNAGQNRGGDEISAGNKIFKNGFFTFKGDHAHRKDQSIEVLFGKIFFIGKFCIINKCDFAAQFFRLFFEPFHTADRLCPCGDVTGGILPLILAAGKLFFCDFDGSIESYFFILQRFEVDFFKSDFFPGAFCTLGSSSSVIFCDLFRRKDPVIDLDLINDSAEPLTFRRGEIADGDGHFFTGADGGTHGESTYPFMGKFFSVQIYMQDILILVGRIGTNSKDYIVEGGKRPGSGGKRYPAETAVAFVTAVISFDGGNVDKTSVNNTRPTQKIVAGRKKSQPFIEFFHLEIEGKSHLFFKHKPVIHGQFDMGFLFGVVKSYCFPLYTEFFPCGFDKCCIQTITGRVFCNIAFAFIQFVMGYRPCFFCSLYRKENGKRKKQK